MKVKELINKLSNMPSDMEVYIELNDCSGLYDMYDLYVEDNRFHIYVGCDSHHGIRFIKEEENG